MNKKSIIFILLSSFFIGGIGGWIFTRYIIPKMNTVGWLVRYNLVPTSAPLVINTKQEIRVNEGADSIATAQAVKPWVVGILDGSDPQHLQISGSGIVLTSDGLIATTKTAVSSVVPNVNFSNPGNSVLNVSFPDGSIKQALISASDPASDLVFLKANNVSNLATASLGFPKDLQLGQRVLVISPSLVQNQAGVIVSYVSSEVGNVKTGVVYSSDQINKTFGVDGSLQVMEGSAISSLDNNIQGLYGKNGVIPADSIRSAFDSFTQNQKIIRDYLGIHYEYISSAAANLFSSPQGVLVVRPDKKIAAVAANSPAAKSGLQEGDIITAVDDVAVNANNSFEDLLYKHSSGENVKFTIFRNKSTQDLSVLLGAE